MFSLLSVLKAVLSLGNYLAKIAHDRQLLTAGEYKAIANASIEALNNVKAAKDARSGVSHDDDSLPNDPNNRD
jgi:hypothetical protein